MNSFPPPPATDSAATMPVPLEPRRRGRIASRLRRQARELGAAFALDRDGTGEQLEWSIDPEPVLIAADTWATIEAAVRQRARLMNLLLADIYSGQDALRARVLPPEVVLADPFFRRPCVGLDATRISPATLLRFDLLPAPAGGWMFVETFANTPIGASFAVQNRRLLTQERSEFFAALPDVRSIAAFPRLLLDHLKRLSPRETEHPSVIVLTTGATDPTFFEHSFLARRMGVPLAQSGDLIAIDDRIFFKTVAGLVPVDVIYRRVNDAHIDPVAFPTRQLSGVPGLLGAIRARGVTVANAVGVGVADSRAIQAYVPGLLRFFLAERPLLPDVPTFYCGDVDQLALVTDSPQDFAITPAQAAQTELPAALIHSPPRMRQRAVAAMHRTPHAYVARRFPSLEASADAASHRRARETRLSCYALCDGSHIEVMPGGLWRVLDAKRRSDAPGWQIGETADVVVLGGERGAAPEATETKLERVRPLPLGSRAADHLFWAGRYAERAEATARMLAIVEDVGLEELSRDDRRAWFPVWRGLLEATGQAAAANRRNDPDWLTPDRAWHMTLDDANSSSLVASVRAARTNTLQCRDFFSPETWSVLSRVGEAIDQIAQRGADNALARSESASAAVAVVLDGLAAFFGTVDRTMLHDTGWRFFQAGIHLERAIMTTAALKHPLLEAETAFRRDRREEADLTALLRMLSSHDAYRRTYQTRAEPLFVAELFLHNREAPKSVSACLLAVRDCLIAIASGLAGPENHPALAAVGDLFGSIDALDLDRYFRRRTIAEQAASTRAIPAAPDAAVTSGAAAATELAGWFERFAEQLAQVGTILHEFYFSLRTRALPDPRPVDR